MSPFTSTVISLVFLAAGVYAVLSMLNIQGRAVTDRELLVRRHRVAAYIFVAIFLLMFSTMIHRVEDSWESSSPRDTVHNTLAVAVLVLLTIKILIARFYRRLLTHLVGVGIVIYTLTFTMVGIPAGYYIIWKVQGRPYIHHHDMNKKILDISLGKQLFIQRCSTCHILNEIMRPRSEHDWERVVNEMVDLARPRIKPDEAAQILNFVVTTLSPRLISPESTAELIDFYVDTDPLNGRTATGAGLIGKYCLPCHSATELLEKDRSPTEWKLIAGQMREMAPEMIPADMIDRIVQELNEMERQHPPDNQSPTP